MSIARPTILRRRAVSAVVTALAVAAGACSDSSTGPGGNDPQPAANFRRLLVSDTLAFARIYDLGPTTPARVDSMGGLPGRVTYLYSPKGRIAFAHFQSQNRVAFIDGGVYEQNGQGVRQTPRIVGTYDDVRPIHGNYLGPVASVHFDGSGNVRFWDETMVAAGNTQPMLTVNTGPAHHGAGMAKPGAQFVSASVRSDAPGVTSPNGVVVYDRQGQQVGITRTCPGLHGLAGNAEGVLYGCADGGLHVRMTGTAPVFSKITHATDVRFGIGTVWATEAQPRYLVRMSIRGASPVSLDDRRIGVADATTGTMQPIDLPELDWTAALTHDGAHALVLGRSGTLYVVSLATRQVTGQLANLVPAMPTAGTFVTPHLADAEGLVYMTNPAQGQVLELAITNGVPTVARRITTGGTPERVAVLGVRANTPLVAAP